MAGRIQNTIRRFLDSESSGGILLMGSAVLALIVANSPWSEAYFHALHVYLGPLSLQHWINDALMALFFLLVLCTLIGQQCDHLIQLRLDPADAVIGASGVPGQSELLERRSPSFGRFRLALR